MQRRVKTKWKVCYHFIWFYWFESMSLMYLKLMRGSLYVAVGLFSFSCLLFWWSVISQLLINSHLSGVSCFVHVLCAHTYDSNCQVPYLNQRKEGMTEVISWPITCWPKIKIRQEPYILWIKKLGKKYILLVDYMYTMITRASALKSKCEECISHATDSQILSRAHSLPADLAGLTP